MLLLTHRVQGQSMTIPVGLLGILTIDQDIDIIHDVMVTHFKHELEILRPDDNWGDKATVIIKDSGINHESWSIKIIPANKSAVAVRYYSLQDLPMLNDFVIPALHQLR